MKKSVIILDSLLILTALSARWITGAMLKWLPSCPFAEMGVACPACGGTRCVRMLAGGNISGAFGMNPYFFLSFVFLGILLVLLHSAAFLGRGERLLKRLASPAAVIVWAVGFVIFGFLRNLI